jgi:hypothetical protein
MDESSKARPRSAAIMTGRRLTRSTINPAQRLNSSIDAPPVAERIPICAGVAPSTMTAVSGSPSRVIREPIPEIVWPIQSFKNSRLRQRGIYSG